jgi:hypothetical protein
MLSVKSAESADKKMFHTLASLRLRVGSFLLFDLLLLAAIEAFMMVFLDVRYLFYDTVVTGGDTASWHGMAHHLLTELLPKGRLTGWDMGNFCGYPNFSFYFLPPFLLAVLPSYLFQIPLTMTLKFAIASGIFLFPVMTYLGLRSMRYRFPVPVIGAAASLLLLFNELYNMFGGNVLSTNSGEFCYMFAFSLFAWFIGSIYRGAEKEEGTVRNGILLGLIGLCHLFVFVPAVCLMVYLFLAKGRLWYLTRVSLTGFGLMAFWILPLLAYRHPYTTPVYMIWQEFVSWRFAFMGIGFVLLLVGPRAALAAMGENPSSLRKPSWLWAMIGFAGLGGFTLFYLSGTLIVRGKGLFDQGLHVTPLSASPIGADSAALLSSWVVPLAVAAAFCAAGAGFLIRRTPSRVERFCRMAGTLTFTGCVLFASIGLHLLIGRAIQEPGIRSFALDAPAMVVVHGIIAAGAILLLSRRGFRERSLLVARDAGPDRFGMLLGLGLGCIVLYFAAHFLQVPDIRFLPPLALVLLFIFFADTLEPFLSRAPAMIKGWAALVVAYGCILFVIFGTSRADLWFRYNNRGYEYNPGARDFQAANLYLRTNDSLNSPRVGYEKCSLYGIYGGDRVFESLPFFAGRQTMEGIHYASSSAARFTAFLQTAYSREVKTPRSYILSRMRAGALPAYLDLYNMSQLILMTPEARESVEGSPQFEKEAVFGNIAIYRYKNCDGRYVDVPRRMPLLYGGEDWVEDFYRWYREGKHLDLLMVPGSYVKDGADRAVLKTEIRSVQDLGRLRSDLLDRRGLRVETKIEHQRIEFTTNRVGLPHLIKVSYYPNWRVKGAHGVYPVSPHLMMVIPREPRVVLTYGSNPWEMLGLVITGATLFILFFGGAWRVVSGRSRLPFFPDTRYFDGIFVPVERLYANHKALVIGIVLLSCIGLIAGGAVNRNKPVRAYIDGYRFYRTGTELKEQGKEESARRSFEKAIRVMSPLFDPSPTDDHQDVIHCMLFTAASHENLGQWTMAEALYLGILRQYPFSRYAGEAYVKIGRIKRNEGRAGEAMECFENAIREDPWSVWARYAMEELKR